MKIDEFRRRVIEEFGAELDQATPANVREFLDRLNLGAFADRPSHPLVVLNEPGRDYEEVVKDTFARLLKLPPDEAMPTLWLIAFELSFAVIEYQYGEAFERLLQGPE